MNRRHFLRLSAMGAAATAAVALAPQAFAGQLPQGRPAAIYTLRGAGQNATVTLYRGKGKGRVTAVIDRGGKTTIQRLRVRGASDALGGFQKKGGATQMSVGGKVFTIHGTGRGGFRMGSNQGDEMEITPAVAPAIGIFGVVAGLAVAYVAASAVSYAAGKVAEVLGGGEAGEVSQEGDEEEITDDDASNADA